MSGLDGFRGEIVGGAHANASILDPAAALRPILAEICELLDRPDADTGWQRTEIEEARATMRSHLRRVEAGDLSGGWDLVITFAPTGLLQETAMASGWHERYMELASRFDDLANGSAWASPPAATP